MSAYLQRIDIAGVEEVGVDGIQAGAFTQRVNIVEVVDSDGNPWEPVPGPDPFDELVVVQQTTWSEDNVYAVGETISGTSAPSLVVLVMRPIVLVFSFILQQRMVGLTQNGLSI